MSNDRSDEHGEDPSNQRNQQRVSTEPVRDLLTVDQAATYLHVSTSSIRSYIRQGKLKAFRVAGIRQVRIPHDELLKLLEPARE